MTKITCLLLFFLLSLATFPTARAQDRAPHGLAQENPIAFSPSAFEFFHAQPEGPDAKIKPCAVSGCSPLPMAANVEGATADQLQESKLASMSHNTGRRVGAGGIAGIIFGLAFAVFLAMGAYYLTRKRHTNMNRTNSVQPDA